MCDGGHHCRDDEGGDGYAQYNAERRTDEEGLTQLVFVQHESGTRQRKARGQRGDRSNASSALIRGSSPVCRLLIDRRRVAGDIRCGLPHLFVRR